MNLEKVIFGFFTIFACTLNFGFFLGELDEPYLHHPSELFAAIVVNLIALVIKFGDRTQLGATHLADHDEEGTVWATLADPEGNEFDVAAT